MHDIKAFAFLFNVRCRGYDEKCELLRTVARIHGRQGIIELAEEINTEATKLENYANLREFFEDKNRSRRQRKKLIRRSESDYIPGWISIELSKWKEKSPANTEPFTEP